MIDYYYSETDNVSVKIVEKFGPKMVVTEYYIQKKCVLHEM